MGFTVMGIPIYAQKYSTQVPTLSLEHFRDVSVEGHLSNAPKAASKYTIANNDSLDLSLEGKLATIWA